MSFHSSIVQGMSVMRKSNSGTIQESTLVECVLLKQHIRPYIPTGPARRVPPLAQLTQSRIPKSKISQQL
jgi:hypothetical protein